MGVPLAVIPLLWLKPKVRLAQAVILLRWGCLEPRNQFVFIPLQRSSLRPD
jgi:hypothetical protein